MSIFDKFKDKATELLQGAGDKVSEATGIDLSGVTDKVTESTEGLTETAQGLGETAQGVGETAAQDLGETAQGYADTAWPTRSPKPPASICRPRVSPTRRPTS